MKTNNKIFISFLIFLFGGITLLFIGSKYYKGLDDETNIAKLEKPLTPFSVVVAEPGANFILKSGKQNKIIQNYLKDAVPNFAPYEIRNDTLFVFSVKKAQSKEAHFIIVPEVFCVNIKSITTKKNSEVRMEDFQTDALSITMNKSRLQWTFDNISFVSIQAKDSDIYLGGKNINKLTVKLDKTKISAVTKIRINILSGTIVNGSDGNFSYSNSINLDVDKTSSFDLYPLAN